MKIKICGLKYCDNIINVCSQNPDFIGMIFYKKSPRYVDELNPACLNKLSKEIKRVGVFVNSLPKDIARLAKEYSLDYIQLHGNEDPQQIESLAKSDFKIIKAFRMHRDFNWAELDNYKDHVHFFLFDTATKNYGGSGKKFDWEILKGYHLQTPFFLSGGIENSDISNIHKLNDPRLFGVDVNSKIEVKPGLKDILLINQLINSIKNESAIPGK